MEVRLSCRLGPGPSPKSNAFCRRTELLTGHPIPLCVLIVNFHLVPRRFMEAGAVVITFFKEIGSAGESLEGNVFMGDLCWGLEKWPAVSENHRRI
jgi:hypothetical protein